jgi:hypothetical protein
VHPTTVTSRSRVRRSASSPSIAPEARRLSGLAARAKPDAGLPMPLADTARCVRRIASRLSQPRRVARE